ncbi:hypothetical protein [Xenorhabdus szentirmaii]|uniref:Uncharacterized protein n=2 Tax=Xenorhabdus szentirmaii TaxID=290112 RepID=W1IYW7_9GAMM|nr:MULTISPECIES: hypothetical protein [Xenorhabdus]MBD2780002.1 hypothetical protein [Xenorhabdus sp. 38]MBD2793734.1 hypothetical protein [Xenorhabdus sp. CUL]MBD2801193.1 hypothetical protein [Xenorhabdus sp. M]MBD2805449.1 hypothetical protein [Xenorhabdus sp. ZM]MBD2822225.1 hypothetical protein [Xenorhabdus sp. 42]
MFKKLLTVGTLATALIAGIGTASAAKYCSSPDAQYANNGKYFRYVINPSNTFANVFVENTRFGKIKWYFKQNIGACEYHTGRNAFQAYYEGRLIK